MSFASRLVERLQRTVQNARVKRLADDEKRAILVLLHAVAVADGVLSTGEDDAMAKAASQLGVSLPKDLALPDAVALLSSHERALDLACLLVADAFFVDGDYDAAEKEFVASFGKRFHLSENPLQAAVDALRQKKLDAAVEEWSRSI